MGKFEYRGRGEYVLNRRPGRAKWLSFVAGGSGITPCFAVIREALGEAGDETKCALLYANKREEDIWLRQELDALAAANPDRRAAWRGLGALGHLGGPGGKKLLRGWRVQSCLCCELCLADGSTP